MRVIKIDAENQQIYEAQIPEGEDELKFLQSCVGGYIEHVGSLPAAAGKREILLVDEEGMLKNPSYGFSISGLKHDLLVGNGVITGVDPEGDTVASEVSLTWLAANIAFYVRQGDIWLQVPMRAYNAPHTQNNA